MLEGDLHIHAEEGTQYLKWDEDHSKGCQAFKYPVELVGMLIQPVVHYVVIGLTTELDQVGTLIECKL